MWAVENVKTSNAAQPSPNHILRAPTREVTPRPATKAYVSRVETAHEPWLALLSLSLSLSLFGFPATAALSGGFLPQRVGGRGIWGVFRSVFASEGC